MANKEKKIVEIDGWWEIENSGKVVSPYLNVPHNFPVCRWIYQIISLADLRMKRLMLESDCCDPLTSGQSASISKSSSGFSRIRMSGNCLCRGRSQFLNFTRLAMGMYRPRPLLYRKGSTCKDFRVICVIRKDFSSFLPSF